MKKNKSDDEVRKSDRFLNESLVSGLRLLGLDVVPVPPSESCEFANGKFDISYLWKLGKVLLEEGKILSTYGDVLKSGKIISGDDLVALLADVWRADKIIVATDVDGVFTKNPKIYKDAELIKRLSNEKDDRVEYTINSIDVTGGMISKVEKLKRAAKRGIKCQIINGLKEGNIKAALLGDESIGTLILT